jgi:predicted nucleic acid-binding Zn ribbon protein
MAHSTKSGTLQPLAPVLAQSLRQAGLGHVVWLSQIMRHWQDIAGVQLAAVAWPEGLRGQVLFVTVADAIWLQQLTFYHAQLLENIRRVLGDVPIRKLHFTLATSSQPSAPGPARSPEPRSCPLSAEEERQILENTGTIADADLRELVRHAWRRGWEARRQSS